LFNKIRMIEF